MGVSSGGSGAVWLVQWEWSSVQWEWSSVQWEWSSGGELRSILSFALGTSGSCSLDIGGAVMHSPP